MALDDLFGGSGIDRLSYLFNPEKNNAAAAKAAADAAAAAQAATARSGAESLARTSASDYFRERGLDPTQYSGAIDQRLKELMSTISTEDPNPYMYLGGLGKDVYGSQQDALRERSMRAVDPVFGPDFERSRIGSATDDPFLAEINATERSKAEGFLDNLLKRGVITGTGRAGGIANLDEQGNRVKTLLDSLGGDILEGGRENLRGIADRARTRASTLGLGQSFDPGSYGSEANTAYDEFINKLPQTLKASAGTNLYDTSGLSAIAGAAQGPQNLRFDPNALAGLLPDDEEEQKAGQAEATRGRTSRAMF